MANTSRPVTSPSLLPAQLVSRRHFLAGSAALSLAAASGLLAQDSQLTATRILVGSDTPNGILSFAWDAQTGTLKPEPIAAVIPQSTWIAFSPDRRFLYVAVELDEFQGKPTGAVASFSVANGKLTPLSMVPADGKETCHLTTDKTGRVVICANYGGGSAASFLSVDGKLSEAAWSEHYTGYTSPDGKPSHGPVADRQEAAHAHFASISPDNRFVYINDLGADKIHIYKLDPQTARLAPAGEFKLHAGAGPRTLHFSVDAKVAYCVNELDSTVGVLEWNPADGSLTQIQQVDLLPPGTSGISRACDTVLTRDGRFAYFANRDHDFLMSFTIDAKTGKLSPLGANPRTSCGGKIPRSFTLDPTERWMLVANQNSNNISVFARNPKTGKLANQGPNLCRSHPHVHRFRISLSQGEQVAKEIPLWIFPMETRILIAELSLSVALTREHRIPRQARRQLWSSISKDFPIPYPVVRRKKTSAATSSASFAPASRRLKRPSPVAAVMCCACPMAAASASPGVASQRRRRTELAGGRS